MWIFHAVHISLISSLSSSVGWENYDICVTSNMDESDAQERNIRLREPHTHDIGADLWFFLALLLCHIFPLSTSSPCEIHSSSRSAHHGSSPPQLLQVAAEVILSQRLMQTLSHKFTISPLSRLKSPFRTLIQCFFLCWGLKNFQKSFSIDISLGKKNKLCVLSRCVYYVECMSSRINKNLTHANKPENISHNFCTERRWECWKK